MKRRFRLTRSDDIKRVRRVGKSYAHPLMVLRALPNESDSTHIGVVAGRSVGNAVARNRAKRRLRAGLAEYQPMVKSGWDLVIIAREPVLTAPFAELRAALAQLLQRAGLLETQNVSHERYGLS